MFKGVYFIFGAIALMGCIATVQMGTYIAATGLGIAALLLFIAVIFSKDKVRERKIPIEAQMFRDKAKNETAELIMMNPEQPASNFRKKNENSLYVRFFHGRDSEEDNPDGWGFEGPIVGAVGIQQTYGSIKLFDNNLGDDAHIIYNKDGDLVIIDGKYYGDWCVISCKEEAEEAAKAFDTTIINLEEFKRQTNQK